MNELDPKRYDLLEKILLIQIDSNKLLLDLVKHTQEKVKVIDMKLRKVTK